MSGVSTLKHRILSFCARCEDVRVAPLSAGDDQLLLTERGNATGPRILATATVLQRICADELMEWKQDRLHLTDVGRAAAKRASITQDDAFLQQHRSVATKRIRAESGWETLSVNENESPLNRLRARAAADGRKWVSDAGFAAGERLRRDFEFGNLRQSVSSNWELAGGNATSSANGAKADLSDNALDARKRLEKAVAILGPDLSGVVVDVCCFLKGLECVERERRWPPRSAKLMLRTGLDLLASHYGTRAGRSGHSPIRIS